MASTFKLTPDQKIVRLDKDIIATPIEGDLVMMHVQQGQYYGTSLVGRRIWELLERVTTRREICNQLMEEFDVEPSVCDSECDAFLSQLNQEGLIDTLE